MKLREIIETVDTLVPNAILPETKVAWVNQIQNQLFRDYPVPEAVAAFATAVGQQFYPLPADCPQDRITAVVLNGQRYPFVPTTDSDMNMVGAFCTFVSGTLMIYPEPTQPQLGFIYHKPRPVQMTVHTMEDEPTFPSDFHELLVFGVASRVAKSDANMLGQAQMFDNDYRILAEKADLVLRGSKPTKVAITRGWS